MDDKKDDLKLVFSTPIWACLIEDSKVLNDKIYKYILNLKKTFPEGKKVSNILGWHSPDFNLEDEEVKFFINLISPKINRVINDMGWNSTENKIKLMNMWSIINSKNASNSRHSHPNSYISAAYYVKAPKNCGNIFFYDPRTEKVIRTPNIKVPTPLNVDQINITPQEGLLVMFPSYLHHSVAENQSNEERIVVSFNIDLK
tara:strand:- start:213 stop:815 length:603 start_codon:yes stop_codon:yes gene_type:complete